MADSKSGCDPVGEVVTPPVTQIPPAATSEEKSTRQLHPQEPSVGGRTSPVIPIPANIFRTPVTFYRGPPPLREVILNARNSTSALSELALAQIRPGMGVPDARNIVRFQMDDGHPLSLVPVGFGAADIMAALSAVTEAVVGGGANVSVMQGTRLPQQPDSSSFPGTSSAAPTSSTKIAQLTPTTQSYVDSTENASRAEGGPVATPVTSKTPVDPASSGGPEPIPAGGKDVATVQPVEDPQIVGATKYMELIYSRFGGQLELLNIFNDIMLDYNSKSIDLDKVVCRVAQLFHGHPDLIIGLNSVLPSNVRVAVETKEQLPPGSLQPGVDYRVTITYNDEGKNQPSTMVSQYAEPSAAELFTPPRPHLLATPISNSNPGDREEAVNSLVGESMAIPISNIQASTLALNIAPSAPANCNDVGVGDVSVSNNSPLTPVLRPMDNVALEYVNKIKNRFRAEPDKYRHFLDILNTYQRQQRSKDGSNSNHLTDHDVYSQVSDLFQNQEDLLQEFCQFLPPATPVLNTPQVNSTVSAGAGASQKSAANSKVVKRPRIGTKKQASILPAPPPAPPARSVTAPKRSPVKTSPLPPPPPKKQIKQTSSTSRAVVLTDTGRYGTEDEFEFFDKVRAHIQSNEAYRTFVRTLRLFNLEVFSRSEIFQLLTPFLIQDPELMDWFKRFLGFNEQSPEHGNAELPEPEQPVLQIDFKACRPLGASYRALPKGYKAPTCSGRTALCKEVLNDGWISCPEDSTFVISRKTHGQLQDVINRCEDERFELDIVIESNVGTIACFEGLMQMMSRMTPDDLQEYKLDDSLGGTSLTGHERSVRRLYGYGEPGDKVIDGLKNRPWTAVPVVLKRLKQKDEEWKEAQKGFNKLWEERIERYNRKPSSQDQQKVNYMQGDIGSKIEPLSPPETKSIIPDDKTAQEPEHDPSTPATNGKGLDESRRSNAKQNLKRRLEDLNQPKEEDLVDDEHNPSAE